MSDSTSSTSIPTIQPWENSSSPYFLSNSDNPGVSLVIQHLTEENYSTWSRAVLIGLDAKSKIGFIDGSLLTLNQLIILSTLLGANITALS